jgi:hypothetical protein
LNAKLVGVTKAYSLMCYLSFAIFEGLTDEEFENKKMWLKHSCEPWPKVLELWVETSLKRRTEIMQNSDKGVGQIFKEWPRFKDTKGYSLVCVLIDNLLSFLVHA